MQVVSNTSPLIAFSAIGRLDILQHVCSKIWIPRAVYDEFVSNGVGWTAAIPIQKVVQRADWITTRIVNPSPLLMLLRRRLDAGESEAIALAMEVKLPILLNDEDARKEARALGLEVVGALGILKLARLQHFVREVSPIIEAMRQAGIYYSDPLIRRFLHDLHE